MRGWAVLAGILGVAATAAAQDAADLRAALRRSEGLRLRAEARLRVASAPELALLLADEAAARLGEAAVFRELVDAGAAATLMGTPGRGGRTVQSIEFHPRAPLVAVVRGAGSERQAELLDLHAEVVFGCWRLPAAAAHALPLADPPRLLTFGADGAVELRHGNAVSVLLPGGGGAFSAPCSSADGARIAAGTADGRLVRVDAARGTAAVGAGPAAGGPVVALAFDDVVLAAQPGPRTVLLHEGDGAGRWRALAPVGFLPRLAVRSGPAWLLADEQHAARVEGGRRSWEERSELGWVLSAQFHRAVDAPRGGCADAYGNADEAAGSPRLAWVHAGAGGMEVQEDAATAELGPHEGPLQHAGFDAAGERVLTGDGRGWRAWLADGAPLARGALPGVALGGARLGPDGGCILSGIGSDTLRLWRLDAPWRGLTFPPVANDLREVALSADGRWLAAAGAYGDGFLAERRTGRLVIPPRGVADWNGGGTWPGVPKATPTVAFASEPGVLLVGYVDHDLQRHVQAYDCATGGERDGAPPPAETGDPIEVEVTRGGAELAVLQRAAAGGRRRAFAFAPADGRGITGWCTTAPAGLFALGLDDGEVIVADLRAGTVRVRFRAHADAVQGLALSADSSLLATAACDNTARVWPLAPRAFFAEAIRRARAEPALARHLEALLRD